MKGNRRITALAPVAVALSLAAAAAAQAQETALGAMSVPVGFEERGVAIHLDNDMMSGAGGDRDYSWGAALTFGSSGRLFAPLERTRRGLASLLPGRAAAAVSRASQAGIIAMTPKDLIAAEALPQDRPYASLVFLTSSELLVNSSGDRSRFTSLTFGVLGSGLAETIQRGVHEFYGGDVPSGWSHEISDGGEPTARFVHAEQWLLGDGETAAGGYREVKLTLAGSAGYLTEGSAAISLRWGRIRTPWWSFNPELGDYSPAPIAPVSRLGAAPEMYGFVGLRVKARAYNALLQGQFRDSDVRVASGDLARFQAEAWAGMTSMFAHWQVTYSVHVASREITPEPAARTLVWASVSVARAF